MVFVLGQPGLIISTTPDGLRPLFIHAIIYTPMEPIQLVRKTIYRLINQTIPDDARPCLQSVHYRLRFLRVPVILEGDIFHYPYDPNEVTVTHIRFSRFWSPPIHPEDYHYTTDFHPTPSSSPER